eukprot:SAG11_NODE_373_length_10031_cov_37.400020_1_plen_78_part_10
MTPLHTAAKVYLLQCGCDRASARPATEHQRQLRQRLELRPAEPAAKQPQLVQLQPPRQPPAGAADPVGARPHSARPDR